MSSHQQSPYPSYRSQNDQSSQPPTYSGGLSSMRAVGNRERDALWGGIQNIPEIQEEKYGAPGFGSFSIATSTYTRPENTTSVGRFNSTIAAQSGSQFNSNGLDFQGENFRSPHNSHPDQTYLDDYRPSSGGVLSQAASMSHDQGFTLHSNPPVSDSSTYISPRAYGENLPTTAPWVHLEQIPNPIPYHHQSTAPTLTSPYPYTAASLPELGFNDGRPDSHVTSRTSNDGRYGEESSRYPSALSWNGFSSDSRSAADSSSLQRNSTLSPRRRPSTQTSATTPSFATEISLPKQSAPRYHDVPDPLKCPHCPNKAYKGHDRITNLRRHCREVHEDFRVRCPSCNREFTRASAVKRHREQRKRKRER